MHGSYPSFPRRQRAVRMKACGASTAGQGARHEQIRPPTGAVSPGSASLVLVRRRRPAARPLPLVGTARPHLPHLAAASPARLVAQLAPVAIVLVLLLPGPLWIRVMGALGGSLVGLFYSFVFLYEATEGRATKAGYPHGKLHEVRNERQTERALQRAAADFDRTWHHERHHLWPRH